MPVSSVDKIRTTIWTSVYVYFRSEHFRQADTIHHTAAYDYHTVQCLMRELARVRMATDES